MEAKNCIEEFNKRKQVIHTVRSKTFPFSMNKIIEEVKAYEAMNHISDEIKETLDAQGAQEDSDILNQNLEERQRPPKGFEFCKGNYTMSK